MCLIVKCFSYITSYLIPCIVKRKIFTLHCFVTLHFTPVATLHFNRGALIHCVVILNIFYRDNTVHILEVILLWYLYFYVSEYIECLHLRNSIIGIYILLLNSTSVIYFWWKYTSLDTWYIGNYYPQLKA